jgi:hypothetical protein
MTYLCLRTKDFEWFTIWIQIWFELREVYADLERKRIYAWLEVHLLVRTLIGEKHFPLRHQD